MKEIRSPVKGGRSPPPINTKMNFGSDSEGETENDNHTEEDDGPVVISKSPVRKTSGKSSAKKPKSPKGKRSRANSSAVEEEEIETIEKDITKNADANASAKPAYTDTSTNNTDKTTYTVKSTMTVKNLFKVVTYLVLVVVAIVLSSFGAILFFKGDMDWTSYALAKGSCWLLPSRYPKDTSADNIAYARGYLDQALRYQVCGEFPGMSVCLNVCMSKCLNL